MALLHPRATQGERIQLSREQEAVLRLVDKGHNVFFTGPAGTGKSFLLEQIVKRLHQKQALSETAITATTGVAGLNIGGTTIHSYAGIGLGKEPQEQLAEKIRTNIKMLKRWRRIKTWIIDEISMLDGQLFDKLEYIARTIRRNNAPFGGIQLIISGDFFQLPPVPDASYRHSGSSMFAFQAKSWRQCVPETVFLKKVFRQQDQKFVNLLNRIRCGLVGKEDIAELRKLSRPLNLPHGLEPSVLFPLRGKVDAYNVKRLTALPGRQEVFHSMDTAGFDIHGFPVPVHAARELVGRLVALPVLVLKNVKDEGVDDSAVSKSALVNGSLGVVIGFLSEREAKDREIAIAKEDPAANRETAPRAKALPSMQRHPDEQALDGRMFSCNQKWPLVKFANGREYLCKPIDFTAEGLIGNIEARRHQVPLILSWAISIHKSQGQTLDYVKVDFANIFEKGQAYVAMSRARTQDGLQIDHFEPSKIQVDARVLAWYREAEGAQNRTSSPPKRGRDTLYYSAARISQAARREEMGTPFRPSDDLMERMENWFLSM